MNEIVQPVKKLTYIPVGTSYSVEEQQNLSHSDLAERTIFDPRFAGYEADFDWRKYVDMQMVPGIYRERAEMTLDHLAKIPEGQHLLRQALAMQTYRDERPDGDPDKTDHRISIVDNGEFRHISDCFLLDGRLVLAQDRVWVNYEAMDGWPMPFTISDSLVHELMHAADGFIHRGHEFIHKAYDREYLSILIANMDKMPKSDKKPTSAPPFSQDLYEAMIARSTEHAAIRDTNAIIVPYFGLAPRLLQHSSELTPYVSLPEPFYPERFTTERQEPLSVTPIIPEQNQTPPLLEIPAPTPALMRPEPPSLFEIPPAPPPSPMPVMPVPMEDSGRLSAPPNILPAATPMPGRFPGG